MYILYSLFFILGAVVGSFINMAVYRVRQEQNFFGRSYCDFSKKELEWLDLIPIVSYVLYSGKCRRCKTKLSPIYPAIEIITGSMFVYATLFVEQKVIAYDYFFLANIVFIAFFVAYLVYFALYDYYYWEVHVNSAHVAIVVGVVINIAAVIFPELLFDGYQGILAGAIAAAIIGLIVLITKGGGMGAGDIYLFGFAGLFVGLPGIFIAFWATVVSGSLVGLVKAVKKKKLKGVLIQFAPFISFGALVTFFFQDKIISLLNLDQLLLII